MKIKIGSFNDDVESSPDKKWIPLREFSIKYFQVRAIPIGIISLVLFTLFWLNYTSVIKYLDNISFPFMILQNLTILIGVIIIHELIHVFFHPKFGFSKRSMIQIWPEKMFICAYYLGEITKSRSMIIQIMPFTILSIIPLIIAIITQISPIWLAYMSIVNALIACGDILAIILTMRELPSGAIIRSTGWNGFYRIVEK
jgi:hypothetical protein